MTTPTPSADGPHPPAAATFQAPTGSLGVPGAVIGGRYTLHSPIGAGGMGAVWRAHDDLLRRDVAVKEVLLPPGIPPDERDAIYERTLREARAAASLSHPAVIRVYDVITDNERPWIVMELLTARSVADMITKSGSLPPRAIAKIGLSVLGALEAAHSAGVLHRDVKPANVLICSDGRCVLTDFGVARIMADNNSALTTPGMVLGSPQYISPERATGSDFGPPSDLFSLGVTLWTAAEGKPPFDRGDPLATMHAVVYEDPAPPRNTGPLTPVLMGLLVKDPSRRLTIAQTREQLRDALAGPLSGAPAPATPPAPVWPAAQGYPSSPAAPPPAQPMSGPPMSSQPMSGQPMSGQPMSGPPVSGHPMSGPPVPARPMSGPPMSGPPMSGPPAQHPMRATAQVPSAAPEPYYEQYDDGYGSRPYRQPGQRRRLAPWLVAGGAAVVAILLVIVAVGAAGGWFSESPEAKTTPTAADKTSAQTVRGDGFTAKIPKDWVLTHSPTQKANFIQYGDPAHKTTAWIRFNIEQNRQSPKAFMHTAAVGLRHDGRYSNFSQIALRSSVTMGGRDAAELEYTLVQKNNGQHRHALWRVIKVNGDAYEVYMSVPQRLFRTERKAYQQAVKSYKVG